MLRDQPVDAIRRAALFVTGQSEDEIARRSNVFALHAQEGCHQCGVVALHVRRTASVEVAVLLAE